MDRQEDQRDEGVSHNMGSRSRRAFVAAAVFAGAAATASPARGPSSGKCTALTKIERFELVQPGPGIPRVSYALARGDMVYTSGVTAHVPGDDRSLLGDVKAQTLQVLAKIDRLLAMAGTDKSKLISAQIWLTDMRHFAAHNDAWNEWVDHDNPPVRASLLSPQLWFDGLLVEIMVTAAR